MRLTFPTKAEAQAVADRLHLGIIAENPLYRESVELGFTKRWAVPYQDVDAFGVPVDTLWRVAVDERPRPVMAAEASQITEWSANMPYIRVIRPAPLGPSHLATHAVAWGGLIDWVQYGTPKDIPSNAVYAAFKDENGVYRNIVQAPAGFVFKHQFAGWDDSTWPYPT